MTDPGVGRPVEQLTVCIPDGGWATLGASEVVSRNFRIDYRPPGFNPSPDNPMFEQPQIYTAALQFPDAATATSAAATVRGWLAECPTTLKERGYAADAGSTRFVEVPADGSNRTIGEYAGLPYYLPPDFTEPAGYSGEKYVEHVGLTQVADRMMLSCRGGLQHRNTTTVTCPTGIPAPISRPICSSVWSARPPNDWPGEQEMITEAEFDHFYAATFGRLVGQTYAMCGNLAEAQDCVQEAFIRAWDRRRSFELEQGGEAWVRTVAYRLAVSRWRRARLAFRATDRSRPGPAASEPDVTRVALARALQQIPVDQRRAIVLHHLCDLSVTDVALETGAPVGTVKARLARGRAALANLLQDRATETERQA